MDGERSEPQVERQSEHKATERGDGDRASTAGKPYQLLPHTDRERTKERGERRERIEVMS